jgi:hypothetical protein
MSPRPATRTAGCTPAQAKARLNQARAFIDVADIVLDEPATQAEAHVAGALGVLAAIAAADAICGLRLGRYSRGPDHVQAVTLLETVDLVDKTLPSKLRRVLTAKDNAHYSPTLMSKTDARAIVHNARALIDAAITL